MTCGIYMVRNTINSKVYIGQSVKIEERWKGHLRMSAKNVKSKFYNAIRKHGADKFYVVVVEELPNDVVLMNEREVACIAEHDSMRCGYNDAEGGYGGRLSKAARRRIGAKTKQQMLTLIAKGEHVSQTKEWREATSKRMKLRAINGTHPAQSEAARKSLSKHNKKAYAEGRNPLVLVNAVPRTFVTNDVIVKRIPVVDVKQFLEKNPSWRWGRLRGGKK